MFVTKRALSRRTVLRGMGTTLALPFLESMVPAFTALAQTPAKPPQRFGAVYFPNGAQIGQDTPFPSLEFATEDFSGYVGGCVPGYSCTYMNTIAWAGPTAPLPMEINPRVAFERMFGRAGDAGQRLSRMRENRSILDSVADEARRLQGRLGTRDRARLDEYIGTVREIERRIEQTERRSTISVNSVTAPIGVPEAFEDHAAVMFDLIAVAYQADLTRVSTFMMAREASQRTYPVLAIPDTHHDV